MTINGDSLCTRSTQNQPEAQTKMVPELPAETWVAIVKLAVTVWPAPSFNLLADDFNSVKGFSNASKFTKSIVDGLRHENLLLQDYDGLVFLWIPCQSVRHLRINETLPSRQMLTNTFYNTLSDYSRLISLSLCSPEVEFTCSRLPDLSFAATLRRLDLRCKNRHDRTFWDVVTVGLPNLLELRLGASEFLESESSSSASQTRSVRERAHTNVEEFATSLAARLSQCPNVRILSFHILLNDTSPDDGFFDEKTTIQNEQVASLILARTLPRLERISWRNPWIDEEGVYDEVLQRGSRIFRTESGIELLRDDQGVSDIQPAQTEPLRGSLNTIPSILWRHMPLRAAD